ncbi:U-box domain-containing protein 52-like [Pistacia vera]|uniref:U-box domain-containing protein 52-like n=1 Tax=Pistacia vera TaxID=55513 RepID=UPI001263E25B|nr:U-box domain-containing protein 52-like [Pistacia vera]
MARRSRDSREESVAVAIDKDKGSQYALKWAVDRLLSRGQSLTLIHVNQKTGAVSMSNVNDEVGRPNIKLVDNHTKEMFLPFRCFCSRKDIKCAEVVLEDMDVSKALIDYVSYYSIETLVVGASSRSSLVKRFKTPDVPTSVTKGAPAFCNVYVIAKGKISSVRSATMPPPPVKQPPHAHSHSQLQTQLSHIPDPIESPSTHHQRYAGPDVSQLQSRSIREDMEIRSPFGRASAPKYEPSITDSDISFVSSGRPSIDRMFPSFNDPVPLDYGMDSRFSNSSELYAPHFSNSSELYAPHLSSSSEYDNMSPRGSLLINKLTDMNSSLYDVSSSCQGSVNSMSWSSQSSSAEDVEAEMRRLRLELKQTMDMYSAACKEALTAKHTAREFQRMKSEEHQRFEEARHAEEAALTLALKEKAKCRAALEAAEAAQKLAQLEAEKRKNAEMNVGKEAETGLRYADPRYRKYTIEEIEKATDNFASSRKIGEGGYGPVFKCNLDHTPVAVKVLRPDAAQGRSQFQQEVEVLCNIRHPNMVLLLGACPEYGCLVYEYMANGSLEDRLFCRGGSPVLPWQERFRIAAEIGTALLFLHQSKPEPLVHRDLKPGNILLDRNYVSKISDVGLARLVPPSVTDSVTQYRMTSTAGTFCYIDPEYQQTGLLGVKSDVYSFGVMLLQIITAKPPMGLAHQVESAIQMGNLRRVLDPAVPDWPMEATLSYAKMALQCVELRRKDRPDLGKVVVPELNRLRALAEDTIPSISPMSTPSTSPDHSEVSTKRERSSGSSLSSNHYCLSRSL